MKKDVLKLISAVRNSFSNSVELYTQGGCYQFYLILKSVFPQAKCYYNVDHVITRIGNRYYDITGEVKRDRHRYYCIHDEQELVRLKELRYKGKAIITAPATVTGEQYGQS